MPFIGTQPEVGGYSVLDTLTASATANYTLQKDSANFVPNSANQLLVSLNGVIQKPGSSFTVSGSTLTFSSALASSDSIDFIISMGEPLLVGTPSDGTVTTAKIATNAVSSAKIADGSVTPAKKSVGILQQKEVYHTSSTQLTHGGTMSEISSSLRIAITPISASSKLIFEVNAPFVCPNSTHLQYAKIYDITNSADVSQPPANGSRDRVHWVKRTSNHDVNDFDTMNFSVTASSGNTNARTYTVYHRTEGVTIQFLSSTLSSASGATYPFHFRITEIAQ